MSEDAFLTSLDSAKSGDEVALSNLLQAHSGAVWQAVRGNVPNRLRSILSEEDVVQQTFADAIRSIRQFSGKDSVSFNAWLSTTAKRNLLDVIRMLETTKRGGKRAKLDLAQDDSCLQLFELITHGGGTPSQHAGRIEIVTAVREALSELPETYAVVIRLYDVEGLSVAEVAQRLNRSEGAVFMLRRRALDRMGESLGGSSSYFSTGT